MPVDPREAASERAEAALEHAVSEIKSPADAARAVDALEKRGATGPHKGAASTPQKQAAAVERAAHSAPAAALIETAAQSATAREEDKSVLDDAVTEAAGVTTDDQPPKVRHSRDLLREALLRRMRPFEAFDASLFLGLNHLPHPRWADRLMAALSFLMTGGHAFLLLLVPLVWRRPRRAKDLAVQVAIPLWLATTTVEQPVKRYFRRRRPFSSLVRAVVIGRKPGSFSFPSGHSAAAFAGAYLLGRVFPRQKGRLHLFAGLIAFSRIYLGAHYPGDVVAGSLLGSLLARFFRRLTAGRFR